MSHWLLPSLYILWQLSGYGRFIRVKMHILLLLLTVLITDHFSGPGKVIGLVCLCVRTMTVELNIILSIKYPWPKYLARLFTLTLSRSSTKVKAICLNSQWCDEKHSFLATLYGFKSRFCFFGHGRPPQQLLSCWWCWSSSLCWSGWCDL